MSSYNKVYSDFAGCPPAKERRRFRRKAVLITGEAGFRGLGAAKKLVRSAKVEPRGISGELPPPPWFKFARQIFEAEIPACFFRKDPRVGGQGKDQTEF